MVVLLIFIGFLVCLLLGLIIDCFGGCIVFFIYMLLVVILIYGLVFVS